MPQPYKNVAVQIIKIWDTDWYPGFAECTILDAFGKEHRFQDKIPIFSVRDLTPNDVPCSGVIRCVTLEECADGTILIDTEYPDHVESTTDEHLFHVFPNQLTDIEDFS